MEIEQVEVMIEDAEASLKDALRARTVILRKSGKEPKKATGKTRAYRGENLV